MVAGGVSIGQLFLTGYIPGVMLGALLGITGFFIAHYRGDPREKMPSFNEAIVIAKDGILSMFAAVIIVGGIAFGIFTAAEASAVGVIYAD